MIKFQTISATYRILHLMIFIIWRFAPFFRTKVNQSSCRLKYCDLPIICKQKLSQFADKVLHFGLIRPNFSNCSICSIILSKSNIC